MRPLARPDNRLYLGRGGTGKTTLALSHAWDFPRALIFDPNGEDQHADGALVCDDHGELVALASIPGEIRICWRGFFSMGPAEAFDWGNRVAWAAGGFVVIWDEADLFTNARSFPPSAYRIWNTGRHRALRVFALSRRPFQVPRALTANLSRVCSGAAHEPDDLLFLRAIMGGAARQIPALGDYEFMDWTPAKGAAVKKSPFP